MTSPSDAAGSLTELDLVRIARGDTQGASMSGYGPSCTGPEGANRNRMVQEGVCGNIYSLHLGPGRYAVLGPAWTELESGPNVAPSVPPGGFVTPSTMAVLEVLP